MTSQLQALDEAIAATKAADRKAQQSDRMRQKTQERLAANPKTDDLITFIRKQGGIDVDTESDVRGRLKHLNQENRTVGLPGIEQTGGKGMTLDYLGERLIAAGYLQPDPKFGNGVDKDAVIDLLFEAEGRKIFSQQNTAEMDYR